MTTAARGHRLADVAEQAGVSLATVDRVVHGRPGASARAVRQVEQALLELDRQQTQLRLGARTLLLDLVMQAPQRFSHAVRVALEAELPGLRPAAVRARFHLRESGDAEEVAEVLDGLDRAGRTCHGVLLKAPDDPVVARAVDRLRERGVPVVTLVTDVRDCRRVAYVGLDNASAGRTAAYLVGAWLAGRPGTVLVTLSRSSFVGERERLEAFASALARDEPGRAVHVVSDADGLDEPMEQVVGRALAEHPDVAAVYSVGGGNRAIRRALGDHGVRPLVHLGHDLDEDNLALLASGELSAVLHHDLRADMRAACRQVARHHGLLPGAPTSVHAAAVVVTPHNVPARLPPR